MESPPLSEPDLKEPQLQRTETTESKRRKREEKMVITVRIEERGEKQKGNSTPGDSWSWRKYGQKPIKGSPHPRGYYRCSTAKGCPAKKQVERCRTDASTFIITYTSGHNHTGPDLLHLNATSEDQKLATCEEDHQNSEGSQPQSPPVLLCSEDKHQVGTQGEGEKCSDPQPKNIPVKEEVSRECPHSMITSQAQLLSEEDDFFDELGELPLSLLCSNVLRSNFFDERILLLPFLG